MAGPIRKVNNKFSLTKAEKTLTSGIDELFGDGSDGDLTVSSGQTIYLSSDMYYQDLTIESGATLFTNGFRIFVNGTLTNNGTIGMPQNIIETANSSTVSRRSDIVKSYAWGEGSAENSLPEYQMKDIDIAVGGFLVSADGTLHAVAGGQPGNEVIGDITDPGEGQPGQPGTPGTKFGVPPGDPGGPGNPGNPGQDGNAATRGTGGQKGKGGGVVLIVAKSVSGSGQVISKGTNSVSANAPVSGVDGLDGNPGNPAPDLPAFANQGSPFDAGINAGYHHVAAGNHPHQAGTGPILVATGGMLQHTANISGGTYNPSSHSHGNVYSPDDLRDSANDTNFPTSATFFNKSINQGSHPHPAFPISPANQPVFQDHPINERPNVSNHNAVYVPQSHNPGYHHHPSGVNSGNPATYDYHSHNAAGTNPEHLPSAVVSPTNAGNAYQFHNPGSIPGTPFHQQLHHPHAADGSWPAHTTFVDAHPAAVDNAGHTPYTQPVNQNGHTANRHNQHGHGSGSGPSYPGSHPHPAGTLPGNPSNAHHPTGSYHIPGTPFHTPLSHPHNSTTHFPHINAPAHAKNLGHGPANTNTTTGHTANRHNSHTDGNHPYSHHHGNHAKNHYYHHVRTHGHFNPGTTLYPSSNHNHSGHRTIGHISPGHTIPGVGTLYYHIINAGYGSGPGFIGHADHYHPAGHAGSPQIPASPHNANHHHQINAGNHIHHAPGHNPDHTHNHGTGPYFSPNLPAHNPHSAGHNAGNHPYNHSHDNYDGHPSAAPFYPRSTHNHDTHYNEGWNAGDYIHHVPGHNPSINHGSNENLPSNYSGHSGNLSHLHNAGNFPHTSIDGTNIPSAPVPANTAGHTPVPHTGNAPGHSGTYHPGSWPPGSHDHSAGPIVPLNDPTTPSVNNLYYNDFHSGLHNATLTPQGHNPGTHTGSAGTFHFVGQNDGTNFAAHVFDPTVPIITRRIVTSTGGSQNTVSFTAGVHSHPAYDVSHATGEPAAGPTHTGNPFAAGHNESYQNLPYLGGEGGAGGLGGEGGQADPSTYDPGYDGGIVLVTRDPGNVQNQIGHSNFSKILGL